MLANSLADVVAEEAAKRFLPDVNLERRAKEAERIGVCASKRLALVQVDIWAERGEAGAIYEHDPLLEVGKACTRSAFGRLVGELALKPLARSSCQGLALQSLQRVPC